MNASSNVAVVAGSGSAGAAGVDDDRKSAITTVRSSHYND